MPKQQAVFAAISRERAKQDKDCNAPFTVSQELTMIERSALNGTEIDTVLRIAAMAVRCLENHGIPSDPDDTDELEIPLSGGGGDD